MTEDDMDGKRKGFLVALVIGLISGPALALGATQIFGADPAVASPVTTAAAPSTTAAAASSTTQGDSGPDLAVACGAEGASLVAAEAAGTLSDLQQAALDALRPICAAAGFNLSEARTDDGVLAPAAASNAAPAPATSTDPGSVQGDDDGEYDGDGEYEDEGEDHEEEDDESDEYEGEG